MSLSDYLRRLRAVRGGITPREIAEATGISEADCRLVEVKYRPLGDDELLEKLAAFFEVSVERLRFERQRDRKALTSFLIEAKGSGEPIRLTLYGGEVVEGRVAWHDRSAVCLRPSDDRHDGRPADRHDDQHDDKEELLVYRHAVQDWSGSVTLVE